jgi:hypothetical protein
MSLARTEPGFDKLGPKQRLERVHCHVAEQACSRRAWASKHNVHVDEYAVLAQGRGDRHISRRYTGSNTSKNKDKS